MQVDTATYNRIVEATGDAYKWAADDIAVSPNDSLATAECRFFRASSKTKPDAGVVHYALLPNGRLVGADMGSEAATEVLRTCGKAAPVGWWANAIVSFTDEAAGRVVTADDKLSINMIEAAGGRFADPTLERTGGSTTVTFYAIQRTFEPVRVQAVLPERGPLKVTVTPVKKN